LTKGIVLGVSWLKGQVNTRARTWINRISGAVITAFGVIALLQSMK
jgi:threonine/homoserine/homoserine lactone efflux protein